VFDHHGQRVACGRVRRHMSRTRPLLRQSIQVSKNPVAHSNNSGDADAHSFNAAAAPSPREADEPCARGLPLATAVAHRRASSIWTAGARRQRRPSISFIARPSADGAAHGGLLRFRPQWLAPPELPGVRCALRFLKNDDSTGVSVALYHCIMHGVY